MKMHKEISNNVLTNLKPYDDPKICILIFGATFL